MFEGYKVAITGATSGIGLAAAKAFLADGAIVIGIGRNFKNCDKFGDKFIPYTCDVTDIAQIESCCDFIAKEFDGELDVFVNNAGGNIPGGFNPTSEQFDYGIDLLLKAPFFFCNRLHPLLANSKTGNANIVHVASGAGHGHAPHISVYALAKAAHVKLMRIQTNAWDDVRVNTVSPGFVNTPIFYRGIDGGAADKDNWAAGVEQMLESRKKVIPLHRIAEPEEAADLILFLASTDASFVYGAEVLLDGGFSAVVC